MGEDRIGFSSRGTRAGQFSSGADTEQRSLQRELPTGGGGADNFHTATGEQLGFSAHSIRQHACAIVGPCEPDANAVISADTGADRQDV